MSSEGHITSGIHHMREPYIVNKLHYRYAHIDFWICHLHLKDPEKEHTNGIVIKSPSSINVPNSLAFPDMVNQSINLTNNDDIEVLFKIKIRIASDNLR